ncbi:MAG: hypothetical protein ABEN55_17170, partial [Bradymonadaceae bacterium]
MLRASVLGREITTELDIEAVIGVSITLRDIRVAAIIPAICIAGQTSVVRLALIIAIHIGRAPAVVLFFS